MGGGCGKVLLQMGRNGGDWWSWPDMKLILCEIYIYPNKSPIPNAAG